MAASYVRIGQDDIASNLLAEVVVEQRLNSHWTCRVAYRATLDSRPEVEQMHGQPLRIATLSLDGTEHVVFSGIIRKAQLGHEVWGSYTAEVEAVSLSWLMDLGEHHAYFLKQAPQQIAQSLTGAPGLALTGTIEGDATASRVQWAETDYNFLLQLVDDGEAWLRPTEQGVETQTSFQPGVTLQWREGEYGLLEFETAGRLTPSRIDGAHYDAVTMNSQHYAAVQSDAVFYPDAVPQLVGKTLAASLATTTAAHPARNRAVTLDHYQQRLQLESRRAAVNAVTCKGISREPQVTPGNEIVIAGLSGAAGTYGVISCTHRWTSKGYENHFTATPAKRWFAPVRAPRSTASGLYPARIAANHDPHNQGRMQIQYWWLDDTPTTWARLLTAHAGADRGILWYPELGDEVAVRFEQGDPERPVIVGSVWNGVHQPPTQGYWHTGKLNDVEFASNYIKRIVTKSGIRITLNDTPGQETISLATPTSNQVTMTEKTNETGRPALLLHTTGDILISATGRIHANSATHSREVGDGVGAYAGATAMLPDPAKQKSTTPKHNLSKNPCAGKGLATTENEKEFAADMKGLEKSWSTLSPDQRKQQLSEIANRQLSKSGVPPVGVREATLPVNTSGVMNFIKWKLDISKNLLNTSSLSDDRARELGNTVYHESRHAEQWYLAAQKEAGNGSNAQDISNNTQIPLSVAKAAVKDPMSKDSPQQPCAMVVFDSIYGSGAAHRNKTLDDLPVKGQAVMDATDKYNQISSDPHATAAQKAAAHNAYKKIYNSYQQTYQQYRNLPEESDAWVVGDRISQLW